jgi:AAA family ATPase
MSDKAMQFTVRPFEGPGKLDYKGAFRVYLSSPALMLLRLRVGDLCQLKLDRSSAKTAIAWNAAQKIQDSIVQTSKTLQELYGLKLGDRVTIEKVQRPLVVPKQVKLWEVTDGNTALSEDSRAHWEKYLQKELAEIEVCPMLILHHNLSDVCLLLDLDIFYAAQNYLARPEKSIQGG